MVSIETDHIIQSAKELGGTYSETAGLITEMVECTRMVNDLYDHGQGGLGKSLVNFGIALVMFPEPFMVSDVVGGAIIAAGMVYNKVHTPPGYIDDIYKSIEEQIMSLHEMKIDVAEGRTVDFVFPSMHFNL
jgi:hypothetical protein